MKNPRPSAEYCGLALAAFMSLAFMAACDDATEPGVNAKMGTLWIKALTNGADADSNGYLVTVDGEVSPTRRLAVNSSVLVDVPVGTHDVKLDDIAEHCSVTGPNPQRVAVASRQTTTAAFQITCPGRSTMRITTGTTGSPADPDGYIVRLQRDSSITSVLVEVNGTTDIDVAPGRYTISLLGISAGCDIEAETGGPTRQVGVAANVTVAISFTVACAQTHSTELVFVRNGRIYGVNTDGTGLVPLSEGPNDADPSWSPDGRRIAFARDNGSKDQWGQELRDIYVMDADGSHVVRLTRSGFARQPTWSPDGRRIAFASHCDGQGCIHVVSANGDGTSTVRLGFDRGLHDSPAWSPNGNTIAFVSDWRAFDFVYDLYVMNADGSGLTTLIEGPFFAKDGLTFYFQPAWSPDGSKIAVVVCGYAWDNCYPNSSIAVMNAGGSGLRMLVTAGGFARPTWSPNGNDLAYSATTCRTCPSNIYVIKADGSDKRLLITDGHGPSWRR